MAIETEADRQALMADDAEDLTITDGQGGGPIQVDDGNGGLRLPRGVFGFEHEIVETEIPIASRNPVVLVPTLEIPGVVKDWLISLSQGDFEIQEAPRNDSLGMSLLLLVRAAPPPIV